MPLSVFCPETDRSRIRGQDFSGSNRKYPDMFSVFFILSKSMPEYPLILWIHFSGTAAFFSEPDSRQRFQQNNGGTA